MGKDLTGQKFGRLTVIEKDPAKTSFWICRCDCGNKERRRIRSRKRLEREIGNCYGKLTINTSGYLGTCYGEGRNAWQAQITFHQVTGGIKKKLAK